MNRRFFKGHPRPEEPLGAFFGRKTFKGLRWTENPSSMNRRHFWAFKGSSVDGRLFEVLLLTKDFLKFFLWAKDPLKVFCGKETYPSKGFYGRNSPTLLLLYVSLHFVTKSNKIGITRPLRVLNLIFLCWLCCLFVVLFILKQKFILILFSRRECWS